MVRSLVLACAVGMVIGGCATRPPPREVIVYTGPTDPAYRIPESVKRQVQLDRERQRFAVARFQSESGPVYAAVQRDPQFGGFVFVNEPEPHALVLFTGDAESRLRRYTSDPRFKARRVEQTLAELERQKDAMSAQLARLGLRCFTVDGDELHNRVTVSTPEVDTVRQAIADGRVAVPPRFALLPGACAEFR